MSEKSAFAMRIRGTANGVGSFLTKKGSKIRFCLILVPGENSLLQINIPEEEPDEKYAPGNIVELSVKPSMYQGRLQSLNLA